MVLPDYVQAERAVSIYGHTNQKIAELKSQLTPMRVRQPLVTTEPNEQLNKSA